MYVIEVITLAALPPNVPQVLSYFFERNLERGAIVKVTVGNRLINGVVVNSVSILEHKIRLKKAEFQLKKLSEVVSEIPQISDRQLQTAIWLSKTYYAPLGMCLKTVLPPFFLKKKYLLQPEDKFGKQEPAIHKPVLMLTGAKETVGNLLPTIKNFIKAGEQVLIITPDKNNLPCLWERLKEFELAQISSSLSNQDAYNAWQSIQNGKIQIILGTRQALFYPFKKLGLIVVEDPMHDAYKSDMAPRYNTPELAKFLSSFYGSRMVFVSPFVGTENYFKIKSGECEFLDNSKPAPALKTINMVGEIKTGNFSSLSRELKNRILSLANPVTQNKKILIFSPRRGYAGILLCQNCGFIPKCSNCELTYRIHYAENLVLMCHHCGTAKKLPEYCPNCNSSQLKPAGPPGTQKIYEDVRNLLIQNEIKGIPILILDSDVAKNETEEEEVMGEIVRTAGRRANPRTSILIATQSIFSYRYSAEFDLIAITNADSLVQSPDYKTEERLFYQIEKLLDFLPAGNGGTETFLIQAFHTENSVISKAVERDFKDFYAGELDIRKAFSYPPFSKLIKLTYKHPDRQKASREAMLLAGKLKMAVLQLKVSDKIKITDSMPGYIEKERNIYGYNIIIKSLSGETPREILKYVPPRWIIDVDPRTLL